MLGQERDGSWSECPALRSLAARLVFAAVVSEAVVGTHSAGKGSADVSCLKIGFEYGNANFGSCDFSDIVGLHCAADCLGIQTGKFWFPANADTREVVYAGPDECQTACKAVDGCDYFTFDPGWAAGGTLRNGAACWMKKAIDCSPAFAPVTGLVSGPPSCRGGASPSRAAGPAEAPPTVAPIGPPVTSPCLKPNQVYGIADWGSCSTSTLVGLHCSGSCIDGMRLQNIAQDGMSMKEVQYATAQECQKACQAIPACKYFSFNEETPSDMSEFYHACWLKAAIDCHPGYTAADGFTSGPRECAGETDGLTVSTKAPTTAAPTAGPDGGGEGKATMELPTEKELTPVDNGRGPEPQTKRASYLHFVRGLAGPWGIPVAMDSGFSSPSLWEPIWKGARRHHVHRAVVFFDLSFPHTAHRTMRSAVDAVGGWDTMVLAPAFPDFNDRRGLKYPAPPCAAIWHSSYRWLTNQPLDESRKAHCPSANTPMPTTCEILLGLISRLRPPRFPNIKHVKVVGFSAGGQLLDRCMYSHRLVTEPLVDVVPSVQFMVISPSTLFYPIPERAVLPNLASATCIAMEPSNVLKRTYDFQIPNPDFMWDMANLEKPKWQCHHWNKRDETLLLHDGKHTDISEASEERMRSVCETRTSSLYEYKYAKSGSQKYEGCGECVCCQRPQTRKGRDHKCSSYNHYRYGVEGTLVPPDMQSGGQVVDDIVKKALLGHDALYIAGSADVCNWIVQSAMSPQCGFCKEDRSVFSDKDQGFAFDIHSPIVHSCGALWQGSTRLERMKIYRDAMVSIVAPRLSISESELSERRKFLVLVGAGHDPDDAVRQMAKCIVWDGCQHGDLVPMESFLSSSAGTTHTVLKEFEGGISADGINKVAERAPALFASSTMAMEALAALVAVTFVVAVPVRMLQCRLQRSSFRLLSESTLELVETEERQDANMQGV